MSEQPEVRYLTDDRDESKRNELVILPGGNGDWYVSVVPEGQGCAGKGVRICTSGGASKAAPGLPGAIADAYRAIQRKQTGKLAQEGWLSVIRRAFPGPFEYDDLGTHIADSLGNTVIDMRGWGRLTGTGEGGLEMPEEEAAKIQDAFGHFLAETLNETIW